jgi:hypothetical protein
LGWSGVAIGTKPWSGPPFSGLDTGWFPAEQVTCGRWGKHQWSSHAQVAAPHLLLRPTAHLSTPTPFEETALMNIPFDAGENSKAVVTVGLARGFVLEGERRRLVVTAAHCLPVFPPAASVSYARERTYAALLSVLGEPPSIMTECLFVDPVADIAVLGPPDNQVWWDEAQAFEPIRR